MVISSRTPEGEPGECPTCGKIAFVEPSLFYADAPCPSCGALLWFVRLGEQNLLVRPNEAARRIGLVRILSDATGITEAQLRDQPELLDQAELDSMELAELALELEDGLSG